MERLIPARDDKGIFLQFNRKEGDIFIFDICSYDPLLNSTATVGFAIYNSITKKTCLSNLPIVSDKDKCTSDKPPEYFTNSLIKYGKMLKDVYSVETLP